MSIVNNSGANIINASLVKSLRDKTGVGMMECKRALEQTNGDVAEAIDFLKKLGERIANQKQLRAAVEGLVVIKHDENLHKLVSLEVNCETDFVAKNHKLLEFSKNLANIILKNNITKLAELYNCEYMDANQPQGETVEQARLNLVSQLGENIVIRRFTVLIGGHDKVLGVYLHGNSPTKIASIVTLQGGSIDLAREIAMHIAAMKPEYIAINEIPKDRYNKEYAIFMEQTKSNNPTNKPEDILQKIVEGKVNKFFKEITLLNQNFVKNSEITIEKLLSQHNAKVLNMVRMEVGEGLEKSAS